MDKANKEEEFSHEGHEETQRKNSFELTVFSKSLPTSLKTENSKLNTILNFVFLRVLRGCFSFLIQVGIS